MRRYSFQNTTLIISREDSEQHLITGWSNGDDVIRIKRRAPSMVDSIGACGEMMVSCCADHSGEITFRLQQTSPSNTFLMSMLCKQESVSAFAPLSITFSDTYRGDAASGTQSCYIKKMPEIIRGAQANHVEWTIVVEDLHVLLGN